MTGTATLPRIAARRVVELADPRKPAERQPFHSGKGKEQGDRRRIERLIKRVKKHAQRSLKQLFDDWRASGHSICGVALVVGSQVDPQTIKNPHIRAHASEGRLFRTVVKEAARKRRFEVTVFGDRLLYQHASQILCAPEAEVRRSLTALGVDTGGPWRANEKAATLAAWVVLARKDSH